jgi:nitroimidazol reductase NimA-like FMN-containing flavoprotein (pyridoxamine 5'-phosphate oxidase superfamily)
VIHAILDAQPLAHLGHLVDGAPAVTPTLHWREGERVYWHGSSASRMIRAAAAAPVCLTVTLLDAMVLARSGMEHSVNFRSVMVFGRAEAVTDPAAKTLHLQVMMEQLFPGRWQALRPMTAQELKATAVLSLPLTEATAKIGAGMPTDPPEDISWPVWAGLIPLITTTGTPEPAPDLPPGLSAPAHVTRFRYTRPGDHPQEAVAEAPNAL